MSESQPHHCFIRGLGNFHADRLTRYPIHTSNPIPNIDSAEGSGITANALTSQPVNLPVPPASISATNKVQRPFGFIWPNGVKGSVLGEVSSTVLGSTRRPSGCQVPITAPTDSPPKETRYR